MRLFIISIGIILIGCSRGQTDEKTLEVNKMVVTGKIPPKVDKIYVSTVSENGWGIIDSILRVSMKMMVPIHHSQCSTLLNI